MKGSLVLPASAVFVLCVVAIGGGCNFGQSGIAPPTNRIFLPAGLAADPVDDFLYVVNSNSDLRFNAGTVAVVDLYKVAAKRTKLAQTPPDVCSKTRFSRTEAVEDDFCCRDMDDSNVINCNEPQFVQSDATIQIGSFGGAIALQPYHRDPNVPTSELVRRLFVAVRAEPSITYADATVVQADPNDPNSKKISTRCTGPKQNGPTQPTNVFCDDSWKVRRRGGDAPGALDLPEEPHVLAYDNALQALYVGHLTVVANGAVQGGGVSTIDVCNPQDALSEVRFAGLTRNTFIPYGLSQAVASLSESDPAHPDTRIYATSRYTTAISGMVLHPSDTDTTCSNPTRDLTLVPAESFNSSAFLPHGADIRGILFSADRPEAYVLHRNDSDNLTSPAAIVVLDRHPLADGTPANTPVDILEVCGGPTSMQMHDAGRGNRIYVTCYDDGEIYVVDPDALVVTARIDVGAGPTSLVFPTRDPPTPDPGVAYLASYANSHLSVIDVAPGSPTENHVVLRIGLPHGYGE